MPFSVNGVFIDYGITFVCMKSTHKHGSAPHIQALVAVEMDKFFPSLDPKADSKIVRHDLLRVAVVFLFFYNVSL